MKALVGVLIFATIFGLILLLMLVRFVYRIYSKVRDAKRAMEDTINNRFGQNDTGRSPSSINTTKMEGSNVQETVLPKVMPSPDALRPRVAR